MLHDVNITEPNRQAFFASVRIASNQEVKKEKAHCDAYMLNYCVNPNMYIKYFQ